MKQERLSRRGGRGVDVGWGPLWPPAVGIKKVWRMIVGDEKQRDQCWHEMGYDGRP